MKTVPLIEQNSAKRKQVNYSAINNRACKLGKL